MEVQFSLAVFNQFFCNPQFPHHAAQVKVPCIRFPSFSPTGRASLPLQKSASSISCCPWPWRPRENGCHVVPSVGDSRPRKSDETSQILDILGPISVSFLKPLLWGCMWNPAVAVAQDHLGTAETLVPPQRAEYLAWASRTWCEIPAECPCSYQEAATGAGETILHELPADTGVRSSRRPSSPNILLFREGDSIKQHLERAWIAAIASWTW